MLIPESKLYGANGMAYIKTSWIIRCSARPEPIKIYTNIKLLVFLHYKIVFLFSISLILLDTVVHEPNFLGGGAYFLY